MATRARTPAVPFSFQKSNVPRTYPIPFFSVGRVLYQLQQQISLAYRLEEIDLGLRISTALNDL